jgi:LmbE family N-acetylglucosaminyl deacetylase
VNRLLTPHPVDDQTIIVLSPHLDDAVLCCGALLADARLRGASVHVLTVFNGRPLMPVSESASRFHARCGQDPRYAIAEREIEDDYALAVVGANTVRLHLQEALYRKDSDGNFLYDSDTAVFEPIAPGDDVADVRRLIADRVGEIDPDLVLAPLGIGGHVDHLIVTAVAERLDRNVLFYEDVPYVVYDHCRDWRSKIVVNSAHHHYCSDEAWLAKIAAIECYESQRDVLWYRPEHWRDELDAHAHDVGGGRRAERFWRRDGC